MNRPAKLIATLPGHQAILQLESGQATYAINADCGAVLCCRVLDGQLVIGDGPGLEDPYQPSPEMLDSLWRVYRAPATEPQAD